MYNNQYDGSSRGSLSRAGELGVRVKEGILSFEPLLLRGEEFIDHARLSIFMTLIRKKMKSFCCQIIGIYHLSITNNLSKIDESVEVILECVIHFKGNQLDKKISQNIQKGDYTKIIVYMDSEKFN